jgi:hypothetical protein
VWREEEEVQKRKMEKNRGGKAMRR